MSSTKQEYIDYNSYCDISLVAVAGNVFLFTLLSCYRKRWEDRGSLLEKQYGILPARSIVRMLLVGRQLHELGRQRNSLAHVVHCPAERAYDFVDWEMLWQVLTRSGVPVKMFTVVHQIQDGVWACVRTQGPLKDRALISVAV